VKPEELKRLEQHRQAHATINRIPPISESPALAVDNETVQFAEETDDIRDIKRRINERVTLFGKVKARLRSELYARTVTLRVLQSSGEMRFEPSERWGGESGDQALDKGFLAPPVVSSPGRVVFLEYELAEVLSLTPVTIAINRPAYIAYGLRQLAALAAKGVDVANMNRDVLAQRLFDNWPDDLGKPSDDKAKYMATFLRPPERVEIGARSPKTRRLSDPQDPSSRRETKS